MRFKNDKQRKAVMMKLTAKGIIQKQYGTSRNFITPNIVRYGKINRETAYELSSGEGFSENPYTKPYDRPTIYGVTVATEKEKLHDKSKVFQSRKEADTYIRKLKEQNKLPRQRMSSTKQSSPFSKGQWSEQEVNLMTRRINNGQMQRNDLAQLNKRFATGEGVKLSQEQNTKGYKWLVSKWKTPKGKEKQNTPYGYREQNVLQNFKEIKLIDTYSFPNGRVSPLYRVDSKDGKSFDYYMENGEVKIVG